ncbi:MAG: efflux RND transporter permease subunit [Thermoanaerobaculales bacterium]
MICLEQILDRRRLVLTIAVILSLTGFAAWQTMDRREDPLMPAYWGQVVVPFPGADAEMVERLVLEPLEDALAEVEEVDTVTSNALAEIAVVKIDLNETLSDPDEAWNEVREAMALARREFPEGVGEPALNSKLNSDHDAVVLAVTGSADPLELLAAARTLRKTLLQVPQVARVKIIGDPGEQVTVELNDSAARRLGLTAPALAAQLGARTRILPGGTLKLGDRTLRLRPLAEMETVEEIASTPVQLSSGITVPLGEVARVRFGPREPASQRMRFDGEMAVAVAVVAKENASSARFGEAVRARAEQMAPTLAPLVMHTVAFQPARVERRLSQLNQSLLVGILIVAGVVILAMGLRLGLVVASVVPLVTFAALAIFAVSGGVLHQISIAALVIALGMLVDNAIVISENVQWRLDRGAAPRAAAAAAVRELAVPLAGATATTIAAFIPMLLAQSGTADFTRSIPVMIILTLSISYLFAVFVTPILAERVLVPGASRATTFTEALGKRLGSLAVSHSRSILLAAAVLVVGSALASGLVRRQFFPSADRNQLVVDVRLPEGAHLDATDDAARTLERALMERDDVLGVASFMGRGVPRFYYNLASIPWSPHLAQLMVTTGTPDDVEAVIEWLRAESQRFLPGIDVIGHRLEQGPPVGAPIEIRLFGEDPESLHQGVEQVISILRDTAGTADVRHDIGPGEPTLRFHIDDAAAARHGLTRADVAMALFGHTRGLPVGELRSTEDPVPVVVRTSAGELLPAEGLDGLDVVGSANLPVPLAQVARVEATWRPAAINHRNRQRMATVSSQLAPGATYSEVLVRAQPMIEALELPEGVRLGLGGDAEGSGEANSALLRALPVGVLLLLGVLLAEFNSFRRVGIILITVPLAATGVVPGLLLAGQPFGFMSVLGVFALVGIVVNNAIVLLEVVDQRRRDGASLDEALTDGVLQRIRPILLTTATTVAGLLPLAFSSSTLWPPLAWALISGLLASTVLTLVVVPALYRVLFARQERGGARVPRIATRAAAVMVALLVVAGTVSAQEPVPLDLLTSMQRGMTRPAALAAERRADAVDEAGRAERRLAYLPVVGAGFTASDRNRDLEIQTPIGAFVLDPSRANTVGVEVRQPILDPARLFYANPATEARSAAERSDSRRTRQELAAAAARAHLQVLALEARHAATIAFVDSLRTRLSEINARVEEGRALRSDALKIRQALERAELDQLALEEAHAVALEDLARTVGHDGAVQPLPAPSWERRPLPDTNELAEIAVGGRADLEALRHAAEALDLQRAGVRAEAIPRLDARIAWTWTDGSPYTENQWAEGALVVSWTPFAAGTRGPRAAALAAERDAMARDLDEARRGVSVEVRAAVAELVTARGAVEVGARGVEQATETLRVERERYDAGRVTTYDMLLAEVTLRQQRTLYELAQLDVVRAWISLWLASGSDDINQLFAAGV